MGERDYKQEWKGTMVCVKK